VHIYLQTRLYLYYDAWFLLPTCSWSRVPVSSRHQKSKISLLVPLIEDGGRTPLLGAIQTQDYWICHQIIVEIWDTLWWCWKNLLLLDLWMIIISIDVFGWWLCSSARRPLIWQLTIVLNYYRYPLDRSWTNTRNLICCQWGSSIVRVSYAFCYFFVIMATRFFFTIVVVPPPSALICTPDKCFEKVRSVRLLWIHVDDISSFVADSSTC
jgi:hypothetical protein